MMEFVSKMMEFVSKMMDFASKVMKVSSRNDEFDRTDGEIGRTTGDYSEESHCDEFPLMNHGLYADNDGFLLKNDGPYTEK